jgi:hypothetical protein
MTFISFVDFVDVAVAGTDAATFAAGTDDFDDDDDAMSSCDDDFSVLSAPRVTLEVSLIFVAAVAVAVDSSSFVFHPLFLSAEIREMCEVKIHTW